MRLFCKSGQALSLDWQFQSVFLLIHVQSSKSLGSLTHIQFSLDRGIAAGGKQHRTEALFFAISEGSTSHLLDWCSALNVRRHHGLCHRTAPGETKLQREKRQRNVQWTGISEEDLSTLKTCGFGNLINSRRSNVWSLLWWISCW